MTTSYGSGWAAPAAAGARGGGRGAGAGARAEPARIGRHAAAGRPLVEGGPDAAADGWRGRMQLCAYV